MIISLDPGWVDLAVQMTIMQVYKVFFPIVTNNELFLEPTFPKRKVEKISLCTSFDTELQDPDLVHFHLPADANELLSDPWES